MLYISIILRYLHTKAFMVNHLTLLGYHYFKFLKQPAARWKEECSSYTGTAHTVASGQVSIQQKNLHLL